MTALRPISIRSKLIALVVASVVLAEMLTVSFAIWSEAARYSLQKRDGLFATAEVLSAATARAVSEGDTSAIYQALRAIGRIDTLVFAGVTATDGRALAAMGAAEQLASDRVLTSVDAEVPVSALLGSHTLEVGVPITFRGEVVGRLTLIAHTGDLPARLWSAIRATVLAGLLSLGVVVMLALRLQMAITRPLVALTRAVGRIGGSHDYSVRLEASGRDEIGVLVDGFNGMIGEIRERDARLARHRERLEQDVADRTADYLKAAEAARLAEKAKSEFLATMSHEIRTPLNGILVMAEVLASSPLAAEARRQAGTIARSGASLLAIVNDILDLSKIEAGRMDVELLEVDAREAVDTVLSLFAERARTKGLDLAARVDLPIGTRVTADPTRLGQVLSNLVNNALKFTERGSVRVEVTLQERNRIRFAVVDTGIGIAPDKLDSIFEAFSQADQSTTRTHGGTGLGLSIARRLVQAMGGDIVVESAVGQGTAFRFALPLAQLGTGTRQADAAEPARTEIPVFPSLRVLVADDAEVNREVAGAALRRLGIDAEMVVDGQAALAAVLAGHYDLVLMDGSMPEMDGFEAARRIRAHEAATGAARTPIVAVTAHVLGEAADAWRAAGMDGVLHKPYTLAALAAAIASHAAEGRAEIAAGPQEPADADTDFDRHVLDDLLVTARGQMAVVDRILGLYRSRSAEAVAAIDAATARGDVEGCGQLAHALKSMSANVGARGVARLAQEMEHVARLGGALPSPDLAGQLGAAHRALLTELDRWRQEVAAGETERAGVTIG
jgi:two-component system sensor histidine kinase BarA